MRLTIFASLILSISVLVPAQTPVRSPRRATSRVTARVDATRMRAITGNVHGLAQSRYDQGAVDADMKMEYMVLLTKPSAVQQADLDRLLSDQQNPSSESFHKWLTPEEYGRRFGLTTSDHSKVVAWLASEGFTINESGRARNWVAFTGTAGRVSRALHTSIRRLVVNGETHYGNVSDPAVPEALADVVGGFVGLNDFKLKSSTRFLTPDFNSGGSHYMVPADFATIYNLGPLYTAGIDGTGQSIVVVGDSNIALSDITSFRSRYGLPVNNPKTLLYGGTDPGITADAFEADLDLEWSGAVAPKAAITYVYGASVSTALITAVNSNLAPIISMSFGGCEINASMPAYRSVAQQANAQGVTIFASTGDAGAAGCDRQESETLATRGLSVQWPAVMPEVTAVGGTQFADTAKPSTYWGSSNDASFGSALSYIPETTWNESSVAQGLGSTGGGASAFYPKPDWQTGPGVPADLVRHIPDVSLSAALHDGYIISQGGSLFVSGGTSASTPSFAGIAALLNQYQVSKGFQTKAGLGNINPQLYRLAQSAPTAFHDITSGNNQVQCTQGSPDCLNGMLGYVAGPGYDMATGLGSVDANNLITQWNTATTSVTVTLTSTLAKGTLNDTATLTATVSSTQGPPSGTVNFSVGTLALGEVGVSVASPATLTIPLYMLGGTGTFTVYAHYAGNAAFSGGGASTRIQVTNPTTGSAIIATGPSTVWPGLPDAGGSTWQTTLSLREAAGVPSQITAFTIDGVTQPLAQYYPSTEIPASTTVTTLVLFRNLPQTPVTRVFGFTGIDSTGQSWKRSVSVVYQSLPEDDIFNLFATPLVISQNPAAADPNCQWSTQLNVDEVTGFQHTISFLAVGGANNAINLSTQIPEVFGTTRLEAWAGVQGTVCFSGVKAPGSDFAVVETSDGIFSGIQVTFAGPPTNPTKLTTTPTAISMTPGTTTLAVAIADKTQSWNAQIFPANRTTSWLTASQLSGTGPATITLTANGAGFEPGAYYATLVFESLNAVPQLVRVPVMFVLGGSTTTSIGGVVNGASFTAGGAPGMLMAVFGTNLAPSTSSQSSTPLSFSTNGITATVNNLPAPILFASSGQMNLQIPYGVTTGPAVLGINNNGQVAGFAFNIAPSAPGIFVDGSNAPAGAATVAQGGQIALFVTGVGDVSTGIATGFSPTSSTPKPLLPLSVSVGGVQAFVQFFGITPGLIGTMQVNIIVPASVPAGVQPVVVTVNGVPSASASVTVTAK